MERETLRRCFTSVPDVEMTPGEVKRVLGVSAKTVYNLRNRGALAIRSLDPPRFSALDVAKFLFDSVAARFDRLERCATIKQTLEQREQSITKEDETKC